MSRHTCDLGIPDRSHPLSTDMAHCNGCNPPMGLFLHTCDIGVPDRSHPLSTDMAHCNGCNPDVSGARIPDGPEIRAALEDQAIPRCRQWREANPEHVSCFGPVLNTLGTACQWVPAPYCPSAYCPRCAGLRALDGEPPLRPNEWMYTDGSAQ